MGVGLLPSLYLTGTKNPRRAEAQHNWTCNPRVEPQDDLKLIDQCKPNPGCNPETSLHAVRPHSMDISVVLAVS